jgi:UDP-N-acetyl-D-glucosamine dehydrogenase
VRRMSADPDRLVQRIQARDFTVAVIGLGYVGLPLVRALTQAGLRALGLDIDPDKVARLNTGRSYLNTLPDADVAAMRATGLFEATADADRLRDADAVLLCVPTPLDAHREPDLTYVVETTRAVAERLKPGQLIVLESTTYPGTTRDVMQPILEAGGLKSGRDFFLAYSPEREDPGNADYSTSGIPKVVGGDGPAALRVATALYGAFVARVVPVASCETAEAVKITENVFRAVNIALVNELKLVFDSMGIDVWDVIDAAATKPFGFMPFYPGPGLGGHCIPIDPFYLTWKAREYDHTTRFIELAGEINRAMPLRVVEKLVAALDATHGKGLRDSRILLVGVAYKKNVDDTRESPAFKLLELLEARGARTAFHDPFVSAIPKLREHPEFAGRKSVGLDAIETYDAVLVVTDHDKVDWERVAQARLVVDTRNALARRALTPKTLVKA